MTADQFRWMRHSAGEGNEDLQLHLASFHGALPATAGAQYVHAAGSAPSLVLRFVTGYAQHYSAQFSTTQGLSTKRTLGTVSNMRCESPLLGAVAHRPIVMCLQYLARWPQSFQVLASGFYLHATRRCQQIRFMC